MEKWAASEAGDLSCDQIHCICSAVLAHLVLKERLNIFGILGCILCIVGSITIVLHAPEEQPITSLLQVWRLALQPGKKVLPSVWLLGGMQIYKPQICSLQLYKQLPIGVLLRVNLHAASMHAVVESLGPFLKGLLAVQGFCCTASPLWG